MRFYRFRDLKTVHDIPWTAKHLYTLEREGKFPKRVHLGPMTVAWVADEVDKFIMEKVRARYAREEATDA